MGRPIGSASYNWRVQIKIMMKVNLVGATVLVGASDPQFFLIDVSAIVLAVSNESAGCEKRSG